MPPQPWLPKNMPQPPTYAKANANGFPVIALALTSDAYDARQSSSTPTRSSRREISQIDGVAAVFIGGGGRPAVRIEANPRAVADMNLSLEVRASRIAATDDQPKGEISDGTHAISLALNDQLYKASDYQNVVVAINKSGAPIKLRDVATSPTAPSTGSCRLVQRQASAVDVRSSSTPDANVVKTVDEIRAAMPQLQRWIPAAIKMHVFTTAPC